MRPIISQCAGNESDISSDYISPECSQRLNLEISQIRPLATLLRHCCVIISVKPALTDIDRYKTAKVSLCAAKFVSPYRNRYIANFRPADFAAKGDIFADGCKNIALVRWP